MPNDVRVRLLGGYEIWHEDRKVEGFESQKVRALLAYLVSHRDRVFSRDHLAGLLWPERNPDAARHVLRQAIYNIRSALPGTGEKTPVIISSSLGIQINPLAAVWVDVAHFEEALRRGRERDSLDPHQISVAAQLYRGDFLAGFYVKNSEAFEEWMVTEQERLRESAIDGLQTLIDIYFRRGEYRIGIHFARRLMALEPLSEEICRALMRMCSRAGRRHLALAEYERLHKRLQSELGVAPLRETRELHQAILQDTTIPDHVLPEDDLPIGPLVPLVGRAEPLSFLRAGWQRVLAGRGQLTLVTGGPGSGKTRLIRSFLDAATSQRSATVLKAQGHGGDPGPSLPFQMLTEILASAVTDPTEAAERALAEAPGEHFAELSLVCPLLRELRTDLLPPGPERAVDRELLFEAVARFLEHLCAKPGAPGALPLILFLDDVDLADLDSLDLLEHLVRRLADRPVWFLVSSQGRKPVVRLIRAADEEGGDSALQIPLDPLSPANLREIADSLVGDAQSAALVRWLEVSGGLPLAVSELVNVLWSEKLLVPSDGRWTLAQEMPEGRLGAGSSLRELSMARLRCLPSSTRRLASMAAVAGWEFDSNLLKRAADEHRIVVDLALEILLERWLVRQRLQHWASGRRERDIVLWQRGARQGSFEFSHSHVRRLIYEDVPPLRRQILHRQIAEALEEIHRADTERPCELLAHHYTEAGAWEKAFAYLEMSALRARFTGAWHTCLHYCGQALKVLSRLEAASPSDFTWREARRRMQGLQKEQEVQMAPARPARRYASNSR